jgi:serine/threonine-protein kinase RsbW
MPSIDLTESAAPGRPDVHILALKGTLDIATLPDFEGALNRLRNAGHFKVAVDLAGLEYISSSGLGAFLGMVDHFRKAGGDLAFVSLTDRVSKIFKVVGFHRLLTILPGVPEALDLFAGPKAELSQLLISSVTAEPHSGDAFDVEIQAADSLGRAVEAYNGEAALRPSAGIVSPTKIGPFTRGIWRGRLVLTGPGSVTLRASAGDAAGEASFNVVETKAPAVLPVHLSCPGCGLRTEIHAFNVYRCRDCDEVYFVDRWAHAISLKPGRRGQPALSKSVKVELPADVNLLAALRVFTTAMLREHGYPADLVNDLELAADEAVTNVIEHAYRYDTKRSFQMELLMEKSQVQVFIRDNGEPFTPGEAPKVDLDRHIAERRTGGLGVHLMHTMMDKVEHRRENGQNVLILTRTVKA